MAKLVICKTCNKELPHKGHGLCGTCYARNKRRKNPAHFNALKKANYPANKELILARNVKQKQIKKTYITKIKSVTACADCKKLYHPICMDFDHIIGEKIGNVAHLANSTCSWEKFLAEIAKCELVCSNCHRLRTYNRRINNAIL